VALPAVVADAGVRVIDALAVETSGHLLAGVAVMPGPAIVADALIGAQTNAVGAVGANWSVAVGPLPAVIAVAFEGISTRAVIASGQGNADVAVGTLPADLASAEIGGPALAVDASQSVVVADWLQTWVQGSFFILEVRLPPSRLADDIAFPVADIPGGVPQVLRLAGVVVDVQCSEAVRSSGMTSQESDDESNNHS